jgi:hypothetical protein
MVEFISFNSAKFSMKFGVNKIVGPIPVFMGENHRMS